MIASEHETLKWSSKKGFRIGLVPTLPVMILAAVFVVAVFAPVLAPHSPIFGNLPHKLMPPAWMEGGSRAYLLGTDFLGRDILSRVFYGARISLVVALLAVFFSGSVGTVVGLIAGYSRGLLDPVLMRVTDIALSLPLILMAIVLVAALGPSFFNVVLVIVLLLWPRYARQIRGEALNIREQEFVALAHVAGCSRFRIIWRHILPNAMPTLLVLATFQIGYIILLEASLSFLGVGLPPPTPAWGLMVAEGRGVIGSAWWVSLWPGMAIFLTVLSGNLLGDWVRDRLDPKLRQV